MLKIVLFMFVFILSCCNTTNNIISEHTDSNLGTEKLSDNTNTLVENKENEATQVEQNTENQLSVNNETVVENLNIIHENTWEQNPKETNISPTLEQNTIEKTSPKKIKLVHFSSWEASLLPLAYGNKNLGGGVYLASVVDFFRTDSDVIVCSTGNFFRGDTKDRRPVVDTLNAIGLDICTISNLELNYGAEGLRDKLEDAKFKVLSANVYENDTLIFPSSSIIEKNGFKIGFIGITSREAAVECIPEAIENLVFREPMSDLKKIIPQLKNTTDILIVLSNLRHSEDVELATNFPEIDIIIGRYDVDSANLNSKIGNTTISRINKKQGSQLSTIDIVQDNNSIKIQTPQQHEVGPDAKKFKNLSLHSEASSLISLWQTQEKKRQEILCHTEVLLQGNYENIRQQETNLGNLFADIMLATHKEAQISFINSGAIRASIPKGALTYGMILDALPYKNNVVGIELKGKVIKEALENAVARYESIPGSFLQVGGISFSFSKSSPVFSRIKEIKIQGEALNLEKTYKVITLDYIASGGDDYIMLKNQHMFFDSQQDLPALISEHLRGKENIYPRLEGRITILK